MSLRSGNNSLSAKLTPAKRRQAGLRGNETASRNARNNRTSFNFGANAL